MSASPPSAAPLPSLPVLAHSKLTALPAVDMEHDRLARACGQGPVLQFAESFSPSSRAQGSHASTSSHTGNASTGEEPPHPDDLVLDVSFALSWGLRPRATSVRVPQRRSSPRLPSRPRSASQPACIPVFAPSSPRGVLRSLRDALDLQGLSLEDCLDVQAVFERWDTLSDRAGLGRSEAVAVHHKAFGSPVGMAVKCASMSTVLGGYQHHIPWVVYACVEELNRTGIYQPGLFRAVPNRTRLARLVEAFDMCSPACAASSDVDDFCPRMTPTQSTTRASLRKESMPDICALLKTYLDLMPEPLLDANLTSALHLLCVQPSIDRENEAADENDNDYFASHSRARSAPPSASRFATAAGMPLDVPMTPSEHRDARAKLEAPQILIAQHLLRLAPPTSLGLLAYLLGFFTQLPLCPDNGMDFSDVARMFGRVLVGGPHVDIQVVRESVHWLLERWARISDGLFDVAAGADDDGHAESAPVSACKATFAASPVYSPPSSSSATTPRHVRDLSGGESGMGSMRLQMPYDPGLRECAMRPHSTSQSSDGGSSVTSASLGTDEMCSPVFACPTFVRVKEAMGGEGARLAVREYEAAYDPFDRGARVVPNHGLVAREYVSCPPSPRRYFACKGLEDAQSDLLPSPPTSVRSLEVESSWAGYSESTSRRSPSPLDSTESY
ncbi:Rho GTPase activation protein [Trametes cingulata]|nr:Rho GTPase activation protein [Trametes cingulata]